jgi:hypothetical protein
VNARQFFALLARLPARVWLQLAVGLFAFLALAVLGFALIAGVAAVALLTLAAFKARIWLQNLFSGGRGGQPPTTWSQGRVTDVTYEIVDRHKDDR